MKIAKIIATSFFPRVVREETILTGDPPVYTLHSQNFTTVDEIKKLILFNIEQENNCDPGFPVDIVFVNNDVGNLEGNNFIKKLNGQSLKNGKIITIQNINKGWSYGAFSRGFKELNEIYDYFIFTEDDVLISRKNYAKISLDIFNKNENCGFVSYWGITNHIDKSSDNQNLIHAHGASGFSSSKVLNKIYKKYGKLPHSELSEKKDYYKIISEGEIQFTNVILQMGYNILEAPHKLFDPAYDLMRGIDKPWKPKKFESLRWSLLKKLRKIAYNLLISLKLYKIYKFIKIKILSK